jgi:hypothetical protein
MGNRVSVRSIVGLDKKFIITLEIYAQDSNYNDKIFEESANFL